ncbi:fungal-specific transcription factor [Aspergillus avenaceus]|uniref:Fungal-specific transcription factor n=1 Tax=Aspergillus avenaceus TaxID=36643 RepID=A0A5N6TY48_ASPAV|nr:fungal-specific transcription factor [Aspergillus avenaceus]
MPTYPIRRRPRECKTCLPCRASKVRCDRNVPCGNCVKRNFSCSYGRPPPAQPKPPLMPDAFPSSTSTATTPQAPPVSSFIPTIRDDPSAPYNVESAPEDAAAPSDTVTISQIEWDEVNSKMRAMEQILTSLNSLFQGHSAPRPTDPCSDQSVTVDSKSPASQGIYGSNGLRPGSIHIGSKSALVDILDKSKGFDGTAEALPKEDLLAELAMENEAASYPFVDLWSSDPYTFNIAGVCDVLPEDEQCRVFFQCYKNIGAVLYPVLPDIVKFEADMHRLLEGRQKAAGVYKPDVNGLVKPFGLSLPFLSLLFAVLASGCQLSDKSVKERELTSWVYGVFDLLLLTGMSSRAHQSVEVIQILLIISNVLSYNMNAGASYTLLGMTERMCMSLGLHVETPGFSPHTTAARRRVWWAMAFQNSHFSLAYDRPSITMISQPEIPYDRKSMPGHRSYFETLCRIISVVLEMLRGLMLSHHSHLRYNEIREYKQRIERILADTTPHLRHAEHCVTLVDHIERTELRLHSSYYISSMCRVSLDPDSPLDGQRRALVREDCIANLMTTIEAFIELHKLHPHASRSWVSLQRTLASAFLLVANNNEQIHDKAWALIHKLESVIANHVTGDGSVNHNSRTEAATHLASSLRALREVGAAFSSRKRKKQHSAPEDVSPRTVLTPPSLTTSTPSSYAAGYSVRGEDGHIDNILNRVSDVMLFPNMNMGNT